MTTGESSARCIFEAMNGCTSLTRWAFSSRSIPTVDPDYKHQSGSCSLSDAGVTIGSQNQSLTGFSQAASAYGSVMRPSALGGGSSLAGDSVERGYHHGIHHQKHLMSSPYEPQPRRAAEEMLEVYAPAGKLGLVIDVPDTADSTPVVHGVKDSCPIRGEINVGDRLVAVDDVDVREMSAVEVSRLISRKSGQERRRLTIVRTLRGGGAIYS